MSYNGTVRCGHCYDKGHNKRGCPKRKKYAAENPDSYVAQQFADDAKRAQNRRCSYCGKKGHNRRGCVELKQAMSGAIAASATFRSACVDYFNKVGLVPGALVVRRNVETWDRDTHQYDVREAEVAQLIKINWALMDHRMQGDAYTNPHVFTFAPVRSLMDKHTYFAAGFSSHDSAELPSDIKEVDEDTRYLESWELASPSTGSCTPPSGFINDHGYIRDYFKDIESPDHYDNKYK